MAQHPNVSELAPLGKNLAKARAARGWTQALLADRAGLKRTHLVFFENGKRVPLLDQLIRLAKALEVPLQWFLSGTEHPGGEIRDIVLELRRLGLIDLWFDEPSVPGAFRHREEVIALAVTGEEPEARIIEGLPAILAWNQWRIPLLRGFLRGQVAARRIAWLADIALGIHRANGFPGGCVSAKHLTRLVKTVTPPNAESWDSLGRSSEGPPRSPIWKRWRVSYPATLDLFRKRAESLVELHQAERIALPGGS
jgi:transcriptional regulator with XRE-family HTH domain